MKIITVNGIRTDGSRSTDLLCADLQDAGYQAIEYNYGRVYAVTARYRKIQRNRALPLVSIAKPGDAIIAHSFGCLLVLRAMELGAQFGRVIFFSAAMNQDFVFPIMGMKSLTNITNPNDRALSLGSLLFNHDFGKLGQFGYLGPPDPRITNVNAANVGPDSPGHSGYFSDSQRPFWLSFIRHDLPPDDYRYSRP